MDIHFTPQLPARGWPKSLTVAKSGDVLTINGEAFDFSQLAEGYSLPADAIDCRSIIRPVECVNGELVVHLSLPINKRSSDEAKAGLVLTDVPDGKIEVPA